MAYDDEYGGTEGLEEVLGPERIRQLLMTLRGAPPELQRAAIVKEAQEAVGRQPGMQLLQQAAPEAFSQPSVAAAPGIRGERQQEPYPSPPSSYQRTVAAAPGIRGEGGAMGAGNASPQMDPTQVEQAKKGFFESIDWDRVKQTIGFLGSAGLMASNRPGMRQLGAMSLANDYNTQQQALAAKQEQAIYQQRLGAQRQQEQWKAGQVQAQADAKARAAQEEQERLAGVVEQQGNPQLAALLRSTTPDNARQLYQTMRERNIITGPEGGVAEYKKFGTEPPRYLGHMPPSPTPKVEWTAEGAAKVTGGTGDYQVREEPGLGAPMPRRLVGPEGQVLSTFVPGPSKLEKPIEAKSSEEADRLALTLSNAKYGTYGDLVAAARAGDASVVPIVTQIDKTLLARKPPPESRMSIEEAVARASATAYASGMAGVQGRETAQRQQPLGEKAINWVHRSGKGFATPSMTEADVTRPDSSYIPTTPAMQQSAASAKAALAILDQYDALAQKLLVTGTGKTASDIARVQSNRGALQLRRLAGDPDARSFDALSGTLSTMARATGDTANIAIEEKKILKTALPGEGDTKQSAQAVSKQMRRVLNDIIAGKGLPVAAGSEMPAVPAAAPLAGQRKPRGRVIEE